MKRALLTAGWVLRALNAFAVGGCSDEFKMNSGYGSSSSNTGAIEMRLDVGATHVTSVNYTISNATYTYVGTIDVSDASTLLAVIGGIEAGPGYTLTLNANAGGVSCSGGSAPFTVIGNATIIVGVTLVCSPASNTGSVKIEGTFASCASFASVSADVPQGNQIPLSVATSPAAPTPPATISWVVTQGSGSLSDNIGQNPVYTCGAADEDVLFDVTLTQAGIPACTSTFHLIIDCPPADSPVSALRAR